MIDAPIRIYDGSFANALREEGGYTVYVSRAGAVYRGRVTDGGVLAAQQLAGYCDEIVPFPGGTAQRRGLDVTIVR